MEYQKRYCSDGGICPKFEIECCFDGKDKTCDYYKERHKYDNRKF